MSRMRLLIVSGRTVNKAAMATCGRARRWWRAAARSRSARVRTGRRPDRRAGGRGHGQRVPDADRHLPGLSGARCGEPDPRSRLRGVAPVPWPGGQCGVQLIDIHAGHRHASGAEQVRGDHLGGLGMRVLIPTPGTGRALPARSATPGVPGRRSRPPVLPGMRRS